MKGQLNKVADALSQYYKSDMWYDVHPLDKYVNADVWLDREMDHLSPERLEELLSKKVEMHAAQVESTLTTRQSRWLLDKQEARDLEAAKITSGMKELTAEREPSVTTVPQVVPEQKPVEPERVLSEEEDPTVYKSCLYTQHLYNEVFGDNEELQTEGYTEDPLFSKVSQ